MIKCALLLPYDFWRSPEGSLRPAAGPCPVLGSRWRLASKRLHQVKRESWKRSGREGTGLLFFLVKTMTATNQHDLPGQKTHWASFRQISFCSEPLSDSCRMKKERDKSWHLFFFFLLSYKLQVLRKGQSLYYDSLYCLLLMRPPVAFPCQTVGHTWGTPDYFQRLTPPWGNPGPGRSTNPGRVAGIRGPGLLVCWPCQLTEESFVQIPIWAILRARCLCKERCRLSGSFCIPLQLWCHSQGWRCH